jgi:hypothetical protein
LEIFGRVHPEWNVNNLVDLDSWRIHVSQLTVKTTGPDKKGYRTVAFCSHADPSGAFKVTDLLESQWNRLQPFLETLASATRSATQASPVIAAGDALTAKASAFQKLQAEYDAHLSSQPESVQRVMISELQTAGVDIANDGQMKLTEPAQVDALVETYKRYGLLPPEASLN